MIFKLIIASILSYAGWTFTCLYRNYQRAAPMGVARLAVPIDPLNILWQVIEPHVFRILYFLRIPLPLWAQLMRRAWYWYFKAEIHLQYGSMFVLVTPGDNYLYVCDAEVIQQVASRRADFPRPFENYKILDMFGPSISAAAPADWARHRKILAAPFMNESIMGQVWKETLNQADELVRCWTRFSEGIPSVAMDTRTLSLNVLAAIGFRRSFRFESFMHEKPAEIDTGRSYRDALKIVLDNPFPLMLFPHKHLQYSWLPAWTREVGKAAIDFKAHMSTMLDEELGKQKRSEEKKATLMTSFVRALDEYEKTRGSAAPKGLSVEEVFGDTFIINFAGHDTTANTLAFAMLMLGAYPEVQEWVASEVRSATKGLKDGEWDYAALFPKLLRTRAIMHETLRLFPQVMAVVKRTELLSQEVRTSTGRRMIVPPDTKVVLNVVAIQRHPQYWSDPDTWNPSRWITENESKSEAVLSPPRDTFLPWSDGPQNCPGIKFSQVEFVVVLAKLFYRHRLQVERIPGESLEQMRRRVRGVVDDCDVVMLLRMMDPDRVKMMCVEAK